MADKKECPWCGSSSTSVTEQYKGPNGLMKITRCGNCHKLLLARSSGEPDRILKSELIERK